MAGDVRWDDVLAGLRAQGWQARVVPVGRLDDARARVGKALSSGKLPGATAAHLADETAFELPLAVSSPRAVVVGAVARPLTQAVLQWRGEEHVVVVPPHYAGYYAVPGQLTELVTAALASSCYATARFEPPLKTLAVGAGLARYGRNNITYVAGLGSYLIYGACVTDAPPPAGRGVGRRRTARPLSRTCSACLRACPTGAIAADRFLLHTDRCLTTVNEDREPFPEWVRPEWHTCAVGCLRCQQVCPENAAVELLVEPPERFDADETAAILAGDDRAELGLATRAKLERCGLDYSPALIARNLRALLPA